MIWIWIVAAVAISWLLCRKKAAWYHYIWMLLPIEMYGVNIAGATLKPYMIFGLLIIITCFTKGKGTRIPVGIFLCAFALIVSDILNGLVTVSIMQHLMFLFILYIAYNYTLLAQEDDHFVDDLRNVTIATTVGYGLVFTVTYILYNLHPEFPGIYTADRYSAGMVLRFMSTGGVSIVRFRGFCIDPNSVITTLIPGTAFALQSLIYEKKNACKSLLAVCVYSVVMIASGSRMAMICTVLMLFVMLLTGYKQANNKGKWLLLLILLSMACALVGVVNFQAIVYKISSFFNSRAGLNDSGGRFTIWKYNLQWLEENGRLLAGVGQNQIHNLTPIGKACHNTGLEWICGTGLLIGAGIDIWIILAPVSIINYVKNNKVRLRNFIPIVLAYAIAMVCVTTVDNITNSTILFLMVIFRYGDICSKLDIC